MDEETYQQPSDSQIEDIFAYKESLEENKHFVAINNKENLAQVFTDCRYTRKDNEALSAGMIEALKQQGFMQ